MIVDIDNLELINQSNILKGPKKLANAVKTSLDCALENITSTNPMNHTQVHDLTHLDEKLFNDTTQQRLKVENYGIGSTKRSLSLKDKRALKILQKISKLVNGHNEIGILWKKRIST